MKTFLMTAAALALTVGSAFAADLGKTGIQLNTSIVAEYDTTAKLYITTYTPELRYVAADGLSVYANTDVDLQNIGFVGATFGLEYYPTGKLDLLTYVKSTSDADFNFDGAIIGAELKF